MLNAHWLLPDGIDELLPPEAAELEQLRRKLLDLYDRWGYDLIFPPLLEFTESLLTSTGGDLDLQTFKLTDQISGRLLGVRADITPQAARIDAHQLRRDCPSRLCYIGDTLLTRPDGLAGSRAPLQVGAELYGHDGQESDLEILCLMLETLRTAGIGEFYLDLGHVGLYRELLNRFDLSPADEISLFDALQRKAAPELNALVAGFGLPVEEARMLTALAELSGDDALARGRVVLREAGEGILGRLDELERLARMLTERFPGLGVHFDLAELRGYHYHTGVVFAAFVPQLGQEIARGGRYDAIGRNFGRSRPACGFSADLKVLFRVGSGLHREALPSIFAPWPADAECAVRIDQLRAEGRRVVVELPGQIGDAAKLGCGERLVRRGGAWVVEQV